MRLFWFIFCLGLVFLYFIDQAIDAKSLTPKMIINNLYHYLAGLIFLPKLIKSNIAHKIRYISLFLLSVLMIGVIFNYSMEVQDIRILSLLYNLYFVFWGTVSGLVFRMTKRNTNGLTN